MHASCVMWGSQDWKKSCGNCTKFNMRLFAAIVLAAFLSVLSAIPIPGSRELIIKLPMRDGVKLQTVIHFPKGIDNPENKFTAVVDRSPYGYGDMEWITDLFVPFGYVAVGQVALHLNKSQHLLLPAVDLPFVCL